MLIFGELTDRAEMLLVLRVIYNLSESVVAGARELLSQSQLLSFEHKIRRTLAVLKGEIIVTN